MKYLTLALACSLMLGACGETNTTPVPPPPGLAGLWQATQVVDVHNPSNVIPVPSGEMYIVMESTTENPIDFNFYLKNDLSNCLDADLDKLTHIGNNRYEDGIGEVATMTANGNSLSITLPPSDQLTLRVELEKNAGLSKVDLATCRLQNDPTSLSQNDGHSAGALQSMASEASRLQ